jgi:hypothetical protein
VSPAGGRSLRLVHYGLGPIGIEVAWLARSRSGLVSVGAIDIDPALAGRRLAEALGDDAEAESGSEVTIAGDDSVLSCAHADVALHCTASSAERVKDQLLALLRVGLKVITTCEELSFPWEEAGAIARELDQEAKRNGVTLLGTGVNPGRGLAADRALSCHAASRARQGAPGAGRRVAPPSAAGEDRRAAHAAGVRAGRQGGTGQGRRTRAVCPGAGRPRSGEVSAVWSSTSSLVVTQPTRGPGNGDALVWPRGGRIPSVGSTGRMPCERVQR